MGGYAMLQKLFSILSIALFLPALPIGTGTASAQEQEMIIVKYGSLLIKSSEPGAKIYVDNSYKGTSDSIIESIVVGEHVISCTIGDRAVSGSFQIKKNETLRLHALFDEEKLVFLREREPVKEEVEKKKPEPLKVEKPKKPVVETKKVEQINSVEERRKKHLTVMKIDYDFNEQKMQIAHAACSMVSKYLEKKDRAGKYYRTKQGVLLCDAGPCDLTWSASFLYTDETGKPDAVLCNWKETVFNGITPAGTSKRELECCLNGQCRKLQDTSATDVKNESELGRFSLNWSKTSLVIRRSDIMKEIVDAGRSLADY